MDDHVIYLYGVVDEGGPRASDVPLNPRVTVRVVQGCAETLSLRVTDEAGASVDLAGVNVQFNVCAPCERVLSLTAQGSADGVVRIELAAANTSQLEPGQYAYDIWVSAPSGPRPVIGFSPFLLEPRS